MLIVNMKRILFIDRDGTLIEESADEKIDSFEKLKFLPDVLQQLSRIASNSDYLLVMVTNQDGLGTPNFPEHTFRPVHDYILQELKNKGIEFSAVHIDTTFPHQKAITRKPGTGMLTEYLERSYDIKHSYVIGDRITDVELAKNLGCKAIFIDHGQSLGVNETTLKLEDASLYIALRTSNWKEIADFLLLQ